MNGKNISLWAKILSVAFVVASFFLTNKPAWDILQIGMFIALVSSPIDISIWIEKFTGAKKDGQ